MTWLLLLIVFEANATPAAVRIEFADHSLCESARLAVVTDLNGDLAASHQSYPLGEIIQQDSRGASAVVGLRTARAWCIQVRPAPTSPAGNPHG